MLRFLLALIALTAAVPALAQAGGQMMDCPMCSMMMQGPWMWLSMLLGGLLIVAAIVALVALTVFLTRRSRPPRHAPS